MTDRWRAPLVVLVVGLLTTALIAWVAGIADYDHGLIVVLVTAMGTLATVLGALFVRAVTRSREEAERLVARRTDELQTLIDRAPDPTLVVDRDGIIRTASERVETLLGYTPGELIGLPVDQLVPDHLRDLHAKHRAGYVEGTPEAREMGPDRELAVVHRDGHEIAVEISLSPLPPGDDGRVDRVVVALRDATLRREARRHLEESISQKSAFLRTVSHELRTPLTAIAGFTDLLETSWDSFDDTTRREFLARIGRNAVGLHALIEEVLAFSRLERGKTTVAPGMIDLTATAHTAVRQLASVLEEHEVVIDATGPAPAFADEAATNRCLSNVLVNAARYSAAGTTITVTVRAGDPAVVIVDDEGPGIPAPERRLVFEQFWRGNHSHVIKQTGTGIGLAVVAQLTRMQGGDVRAEEAPGGGARIVIELPPRPPRQQHDDERPEVVT